MPDKLAQAQTEPAFSLAPWERLFDEKYPRYEDERYQHLLGLYERYAEGGRGADALKVVASAEFARCLWFLQGMLAVKNYKGQVPFPENPDEIVAALGFIIRLKRWQPRAAPFSDGALRKIFAGLLALPGFEFRTVTAIFHFCHPDVFPIADLNVEAACARLKETHPALFGHLPLPRLPLYAMDPAQKIECYKRFIAFLEAARKAEQRRGARLPTFRFVDRALMVLGGEQRRAKAAQRAASPVLPAVSAAPQSAP